MSFEPLKATIYNLLDEMIEQPEDLHEAQESLREKLQELRNLGQPLPQDLVDLELWLEETLEAGGVPQSPPPRRGGNEHGQRDDRPVSRRHPRPHSEKS